MSLPEAHFGAGSSTSGIHRLTVWKAFQTTFAVRDTRDEVVQLCRNTLPPASRNMCSVYMNGTPWEFRGRTPNFMRFGNSGCGPEIPQVDGVIKNNTVYRGHCLPNFIRDDSFGGDFVAAVLNRSLDRPL